MSVDLPPTFQYEKRGKIAIMTINRPDAHNAFTADMLRGMDARVRGLQRRRRSLGRHPHGHR